MRRAAGQQSRVEEASASEPPRVGGAPRAKRAATKKAEPETAAEKTSAKKASKKKAKSDAE